MADIELVVKLPEETAKEIKDNAMFAKKISDHIKWDVTSAIVNGTSLPKYHGDLIDRSALVPDTDYEDGTFYAVSIGAINGAPTVVEADTSGGDTE